jgi:hypothetical protein
LQAKGCEIEFVEITGQPNAVVLRELEKCDFVVDQVYSDIPMASFATEAAFYGKPAVVGGYGWNPLRRSMPPESFPPIHACEPEKIESAIERLVGDVEYRLDLGRRARAFVIGNWNAKTVAAKYLQLIDGEIPPEWRADPHGLRHLLGGGLPKDIVRAMVAGVVAHGGPSALQLDDKPELRDAFLRFAESGRADA